MLNETNFEADQNQVNSLTRNKRNYSGALVFESQRYVQSIISGLTKNYYMTSSMEKIINLFWR